MNRIDAMLYMSLIIKGGLKYIFNNPFKGCPYIFGYFGLYIVVIEDVCTLSEYGVDGC